MFERLRGYFQRFDGQLKGLGLGLAFYLVLLGLELWIAATVLGVLLAWSTWRTLQTPPLATAVEPEVKTYPEGCTCIRGALLDNPRCPHYGDER